MWDTGKNLIREKYKKQPKIYTNKQNKQTKTKSETGRTKKDK